jgi:hypothetical protein
MVSESLSDLRRAFWGGGSDIELAAMQAFHDAGRTYLDVLGAANDHANPPYAPVAEPLAVKLATATTKGDLYIATASGVVARHAVPATNGQALIADSSQTDGWIADYPLDRVDAYSRPAGVIAETVPRIGAAFTNQTGLLSATLRMVSIMLPANRVISSIAFISGTTALDTGQNQWFALFDSSRVMLAVTADDTSNAWAANTVKTLNIATIASGASATYTTTTAGLYYLGCMVKASVAVPSVLAAVSSTVINTIAPILVGNSTAAQTTPPAFPFTAGAITGSPTTNYGYVS